MFHTDISQGNAHNITMIYRMYQLCMLMCVLVLPNPFCVLANQRIKKQERPGNEANKTGNEANYITHQTQYKLLSLYVAVLTTVIVGGESSWTESDAHHTLVLCCIAYCYCRGWEQLDWKWRSPHFSSRTRRPCGGQKYCKYAYNAQGSRTSSRALSNLIVKSSDFVHCSLYWVLLFRFRE